MKKYQRNIVGAIVKREEHEKKEDKIKSLKKGMLRLSTIYTERERERERKAFGKEKIRRVYREEAKKKPNQKNT